MKICAGRHLEFKNLILNNLNYLMKLSLEISLQIYIFGFANLTQNLLTTRKQNKSHIMLKKN